MKAHRIETTLTENGTLTIKDLPFQAGDAVEIIIKERLSHPPESNPYPLRGKQLYHYDDPYEPQYCAGFICWSGFQVCRDATPNGKASSLRRETLLQDWTHQSPTEGNPATAHRENFASLQGLSVNKSVYPSNAHIFR